MEKVRKSGKNAIKINFPTIKIEEFFDVDEIAALIADARACD
jgi:hypothetical protein